MSSGPPIQSISIPRSEARNTPSPPHQVYAITIALPVRSWTIYKRYSDFLTLHTTLLQLVPECPPPAPFPPKHAAKHAFRAVSTLGGWLGSGGSIGKGGTGTGTGTVESMEGRERRVGLETYLRAIIASTDPRWRTREEVLDFLEVPRSASTSTSTTAAKTPSAAATRLAARIGGAGAAPLSSPTAGIHMPGSLPPPSSPPTIPTRQLGPPTTSLLTDHPTEQIAHQQSLLAAQDASLSDLSAIIRRQRDLGLAIHQELAEQNELLGALDGELEETGGRMKGAERKMDVLEGKRKK
ncbi:hypothetical protein A4X06_0g1403 [Tilletia controversa]|uniref:PX domain-containing protein n=1 Tax=Tilletia controversa TaxID=13291 RepID=A0A8X7MYG7_9BASI|nr:hypothetical protein A4X06_0g1403 [Tilletia controversa]